MASAPIVNLNDARAVTDASVAGLELVKTWIADYAGVELAAGLELPLGNVTWAFDRALDQIRDRDPAPDATDERRAEE